VSSSYTDIIRQWAVDTRHTGALEQADGIGEVGLGDDEAGRRLAVRFALRVQDGHAPVVRFQVFGCGFTIATCAAAADLAEGRALTEIANINARDIDAALGGLPPERSYCAELAVEALRAAVASAGNGHRPVAATLAAEDDHTPRVTPDNQVYRLLIDSPPPPGAAPDDRHLFACVLAVAAEEPYGIATTLDLRREDLEELLQSYFPAVALTDLEAIDLPTGASPPLTNGDIRDLLAGYLPGAADGRTPPPSLWLAHILAARTAHPGHLWRAMGLFARTELTAAIGRHLPALASDNSKGMRWKRFLYKKLCEQNGGVMCSTPDCGECSDYALCFAVQETATP
jgi:nitrogen fixation protein NifQ